MRLKSDYYRCAAPYTAIITIIDMFIIITATIIIITIITIIIIIIDKDIIIIIAILNVLITDYNLYWRYISSAALFKSRKG